MIPPVAPPATPPEPHAWTAGFHGVLMVYAFVTAAIWAGCRTVRKPPIAYAASLLLALPVMLITMVLWSFIGPAVGSPTAQNILGALFTGALSYAVGCYSSSEGGTRWMRGTGLARPPNPPSRLATLFRAVFSRTSPARATKTESLSLASLPIPPSDETKHFKLIGTTGTGKSTAIRELLTGALRRGDRAVIADPDAGYLSRFYHPERGDVILNPFHEGSKRWDLFAEIKAPYDPDELAGALIAEGHGDERVWREYARTFLAALLRRAPEADICTSGALYRALAVAPRAELEGLLEGTPAQPFVQAGNERMFGSIRSVATSALAALVYVNNQDAAPFSVRDWIREGRGVLFLPYKSTEIAALRTLISTWMRLAIFETLSLAEGDARLWFVVDELDAVGAIDGLKDALTRLRKFGGRCVLGFQSIGQIAALYGRGEADTIIENCGNTLILRCSASEGGGTAQFASRLIGEREIVRTSYSRTRQPDHWFSSQTTSEQQLIESAVLASEIEQLPDFEGYLRFASARPWTRVRLASP